MYSTAPYIYNAHEKPRSHEKVFARLRKADRPLAVVGMVRPESFPAGAGAWDVHGGVFLR